MPVGSPHGLLSRAGGWLRPDAAARFLRYVEAITPALAGVAHVGTINEPNIVAMFAADSAARPRGMRTPEKQPPAACDAPMSLSTR